MNWDAPIDDPIMELAAQLFHASSDEDVPISALRRQITGPMGPGVWKRVAVCARELCGDEALRREKAEQHPDDLAVDEFAAAMKEKLALARSKGRSGWQECDRNQLWAMLREHMIKGDVRDIANFCMFIFHIDAALERKPT